MLDIREPSQGPPGCGRGDGPLARCQTGGGAITQLSPQPRNIYVNQRAHLLVTTYNQQNQNIIIPSLHTLRVTVLPVTNTGNN